MVRFKVRNASVRMAVADKPVEMRAADAVIVRTGYQPYEGPYEVTPKADEQQTLRTKGLGMKDDVTVKAVPYYEMDNKNGTTIYIASEV